MQSRKIILSRALRMAVAGWLGAQLAVSGAAWAQVQPAAELCVEGECPPVISETTFAGRPAYLLTDGKTAAVIVPEMGRVMSYGFVNGANQLWQGPVNKNWKAGEWRNFGGDKTWPAPQNAWGAWTGKNGWPPPAAWDGDTHRAEVLSGGKLRTTSRIAAGLGARVVREYSFNAAGEFVVEQSVEKISGAPIQLSIWSITQIPQSDAIFLPTNPQSPYKKGFHWIAAPQSEVAVSTLSPSLMMVRPSESTNYKVGVDAPFTAVAAVKDGVAFVQRSTKPSGDYPDGALGAGFNIEIWNNGPPTPYNELEILSPLRTYRAGNNTRLKQFDDGFEDVAPTQVGTRWKHTVRWSLHRLPSTEPASPAVQSAIEGLLKPDESTL